MKNEKESINKYASIMHRLSQQYFDKILEPYQIGGGQQFFLLHIYEQPGLSQLELGRGGSFHKGTTARAVQKLEELGYIIRVADVKDKRQNQLYVTEQAVPVIEKIKVMLHQWNRIITKDLTPEEIEKTTGIMERMSGHAASFMEEQRRSY